MSIRILKDKDIFSNLKYEDPENYDERQTVKLIIENEKGEIALVTNPIHTFFLLPGGGAETDNLEEEAKREAREETNYHVEITGRMGEIEEYRNRDAKHYFTTCFSAKTQKEDKEDLRTEDEKKNRLVVRWFTPKNAFGVLSQQVEKVKRGEVSFYNTAFNIIRDYSFLRSYIKG